MCYLLTVRGVTVGAGRRYYDSQFEHHPPSPRADRFQSPPGSMVRGRSTGDVGRPVYPPATSSFDRPTYMHRLDYPAVFGYEKAVADRPVCSVNCIYVFTTLVD